MILETIRRNGNIIYIILYITNSLWEMIILKFQKFHHSKWSVRHEDKSNPSFCHAEKRLLAFNHPDVPYVNSIKKEVW